jgi:hypothetical protein
MYNGPFSPSLTRTWRHRPPDCCCNRRSTLSKSGRRDLPAGRKGGSRPDTSRTSVLAGTSITYRSRRCCNAARN